MAYEIKTKISDEDPLRFIKALQHPRRREDALVLYELFAEQTGEKPILWSSGLGNGIIGYGTYDYETTSGIKGTWMRTGFAARKANMVVYIMTGFKQYRAEMEKNLGKFRTGSSCLYINKLADIDLDVLRKLVSADYRLMAQRYPQ